MGKWPIEFVLVTVGYILAYTLTLGFVYPLQKIIFPENALLASLLFLPHGIRAMSFFLFGIRATIYLLPAHYLMWYISVHGANIGMDLFSPLVSVLGCLIGYLVFLSIKNLLPRNIFEKGWISIVIIIVLSAFFNSFGLSRLHFSIYDFNQLISYFLGDIFGGFICLILAMYLWRILKNTKFH